MICLTGLPRSRSEAIRGHHDISQTLKGTPRSDTSDVGIACDAGESSQCGLEYWFRIVRAFSNIFDKHKSGFKLLSLTHVQLNCTST